MRSVVEFSRSLGRVVLFVLFCSHSSIAFAQESRTAFEVASVKAAPADADPQTGFWSLPGIGRFTASHISLVRLIQLAYGIGESQIVNKPSWIETNLYDVDAKPPEGVTLTREELRPCLQALLQERFNLMVHKETRAGRGYALVVSEHGSQLKPASAGHFAGQRHPVSTGQMHAYNCSMQQLAQYLTSAAGFPVVDKTGLAGSYDIDFDYNPDPDVDSDLPPLEAALKRSTGLLIKPQDVPVEMLVIDSVEKMPTSN